LFTWINANYFSWLNSTNVNLSYDLKNLFAQWYWMWTTITLWIDNNKIITNNNNWYKWYENSYTFNSDNNYNYIWTGSLSWV